MAKKPHWAKTPQGRRHMKAIALKRHGGNSGQALEAHVAYIFGKVETIIEYYARSNGLPVAALTSRVAGLLQHQEGR